MPGEQNPHCEPALSTKAFLIGCSRSIPSVVVIAMPLHEATVRKHVFTTLFTFCLVPGSRYVRTHTQAPQYPVPQLRRGCKPAVVEFLASQSVSTVVGVTPSWPIVILCSFLLITMVTVGLCCGLSRSQGASSTQRMSAAQVSMMFPMASGPN